MRKLFKVAIPILSIVFILGMVTHIIIKGQYLYKVEAFNDQLKPEGKSIYCNGQYYYVNNESELCWMNELDESEILVRDKNIRGIVGTDTFLYYITTNSISRFNVSTGVKEVIETGNYYRSIGADGKYVFVGSSGTGEDYPLLKIDGIEVNSIRSINNHAINSDSIGLWNDKDGYQYFCNYQYYLDFSGVAYNNVILRDVDLSHKNLIYLDDNVVITSEEYPSTRLLAYDSNGILKNKIEMPKGYYYNCKNIYSEDNYIYMLLQYQHGYMAKGYYNLEQHRHRRDMIVRYNVLDNNLESIYETNSRSERIIGYKDEKILLLKNHYLYTVTANGKEKIGKLPQKLKQLSFEICGDRVFIWNENKLEKTFKWL